jgi:23S rRNA (uracil1939-C5)-methyltransferase
VAERCGGCDLQGAGEHAATLKLAMVEDLLHRQLPSAPARNWHPAPAGTLRHRIQLHWDGKRLGFHRRSSHEIVEIRTCPAAEPSLSEAIPRLLEALEAQVLPPRPQRWQLATGTPPGQVWASDEKGRAWLLEPDGWKRTEEAVTHRVAEQRLRHAPDGFFQVCAPWALRAFAAVLDDWDLRGEVLYDLYGGVGLFSMLLKGRFSRHVLVESGADSVAWARRNLQDLEVEFHCAEVAEWLPPKLGKPSDLLLLDPPRSGLGRDLCARLQETGADRMLLVGCDGAAFGRDVNALAPAWRLERLDVLDLFPVTVHAEFVGLLKKA